MPTTITNTLEGIADNTAISTANSGGSSGTAFTNVSPGTGGTILALAAGAITGSRSMQISQGSTACTIDWNATVLPALTTAYFRFSAFLTALPSATAIIWKHTQADATETMRLELLATGILRIRVAGATYADSTTVLPVNQKFRVEGKVVHGATGNTTIKIYLVKDSTVATETYGGAAIAMGTDTSRVQFGRTTSTPQMPIFYLDDLGITDVGYLGPPVIVAAPTAAFSSSVSLSQATFTNASTAASGASIASYDWDFGDGSPHSTLTNPAHNYGASGTFSVVLTVTDNLGRTGSVTHTVTISAPASPVAAFTSSVNFLSVSVDGTTSTPPAGGTITGYDWNWGDATGHGSGSTATHNYAAAGTYTVTLTVTGSTGGQNAVSHSVSPVAEPSASNSVGFLTITDSSGWGVSPVGVNPLTAVTDNDDTTYCVSLDNPINQVFGGRLAPLLPATAGTGIHIDWQMDRTAASTSTVSAQLFEGVTVRSTVSGIPLVGGTNGVGPTSVASWDFPAAQVANITDYTNLYLRVTVSAAT